MKNKLGFIFLAILCAGACVLSTQPPRNSRFKVDITSMRKMDFYHDSWVYQNPVKSITHYNKFMIAPVLVYKNTRKTVKKEFLPQFQLESDVLTEKLAALLRSSYTLVTDAGPAAARMEMEVVDIKPVVTMIKDGNLVRISDPATKGSKLELNCYDTVTNELLYGLSTLYIGDQFLAYENPALLPEIEKAFVDWSTFFKNRFDQAMTTGKK